MPNGVVQAARSCKSRQQRRSMQTCPRFHIQPTVWGKEAGDLCSCKPHHRTLPNCTLQAPRNRCKIWKCTREPFESKALGPDLRCTGPSEALRLQRPPFPSTQRQTHLQQVSILEAQTKVKILQLTRVGLTGDGVEKEGCGIHTWPRD